MATIKKINISNWMGLKGDYEYPLERITALLAPNGSGKTSFLMAVRFALTGERPAGDMINSDSDKASVEIIVSDDSGTDRSFKREIENSGVAEKVTPFVDGKKVLRKSLSYAFPDKFN